MKRDNAEMDGEQTSGKRTITVPQLDYTRLAYLLAASAIGLVANAAAVTLITGGSIMGLADGVAYLTPMVFVGAAIYDRQNPLDIPYIRGVVLFVTIMAANAVSLIVEAFRMASQSEPLATVLILTLIAAMFTPGPFLAVWATRRWVL